MKKAFDSNVAKFKPRLRPTGAPSTVVEDALAADGPASGMEGAGADDGDERDAVSAESVVVREPEDEGEVAPASSTAALTQRAQSALDAEDDGRVEKSPTRPLPATRVAMRAPAAAIAEEPAPPAESMAERRERLERVKRRVKDAAAPTAIVVPAATPAAAGESALSLLKALEGQLARAQQSEEALRHDLNDARAEQARMAHEASRTHDRLIGAERSLDEKRSVLSELLAEMGALEEERDEAVRRAQSLSLLDEERASVLADASQELEAARDGLRSAQSEIDRLSEDLDARAADTARLRSALAELTRERDQLIRELNAVRRERDELSEARRALEQVHEALAQVRSKLT